MRTAAFLATALLLGACADAPTAPPAPGSLDLVAGSRAVLVGEATDTLVVEVLSTTGSPLSGVAVSWESVEPLLTITVIDDSTRSDGTVRAVVRPGPRVGLQAIRAVAGQLPALGISLETTSARLGQITGPVVGTCGLDPAGQLACRNQWNGDTTYVLEGTRYTELVDLNTLSDRTDYCALTETGQPECFRWRQGFHLPPDPQPLPGTTPALHGLTGNLLSACALDDDGAPWCWGEGAYGVFLTGDTAFSARWDRPTRLDTPLRFQQVALGRKHACGLTFLDEVWCWGADSRGQLGTAAGAPGTPRPIDGLPPTRLLAVGYQDATCVVGTDQLVRCWGDWRDHGLGRGLSGDGFTAEPRVVQGLGPVRDLVDTYDGFAALSTSGELYLWGSGRFDEGLRVPTAVLPGVGFAEFASRGAYNQACVADALSQAICVDTWVAAAGLGGNGLPVDRVRAFRGFPEP
ncbi:MAG: RCC1 domain-containing protein [Gemmatimonadales bacterium]